MRSAVILATQRGSFLVCDGGCSPLSGVAKGLFVVVRMEAIVEGSSENLQGRGRALHEGSLGPSLNLGLSHTGPAWILQGLVTRKGCQRQVLWWIGIVSTSPTSLSQASCLQGACGPLLDWNESGAFGFPRSPFPLSFKHTGCSLGFSLTLAAAVCQPGLPPQPGGGRWAASLPLQQRPVGQAPPESHRVPALPFRSAPAPCFPIMAKARCYAILRDSGRSLLAFSSPNKLHHKCSFTYI